MSLYPHRIISRVARESTMPIQCLAKSFDEKYLLATSTIQEKLQLIDCEQLKNTLNTKKRKVGKKPSNSFFSELESNEQIGDDLNNESSDESDQTDDDSQSDSDDQDDHRRSRKSRAKKKKRSRS